MNVLIMSDTHFSRGFSLDKNLLPHLAAADKIIHCGDFTSVDFFNFLNSSKKLIAVRGNNDHQLKEVLDTEKKFELLGFRIALLHGHYVNHNMLHYKYSDSDIVISGHTHHPSIENSNEQLLLNPGSLTSNRYVDYNTFMVMNLTEGGKPQVSIFKTL